LNINKKNCFFVVPNFQFSICWYKYC